MQLHVYADGQGSTAGEKLQPILSRLRSVLEESRRAIYSLRAETDVEYLEDWLARDIERRGIGASIDVRIVVEGTPRRLRHTSNGSREHAGT